jgi:hypothetical protein
MPLTAKGEKVKSALTKEYGEKKGESVLYGLKNKGKLTGIDHDQDLFIARQTTGASLHGRDTPQTTFVPGSGTRAQLPKTRR